MQGWFIPHGNGIQASRSDTNPQHCSPKLGLMLPAHFKAQKGPNQLPEHLLYLHSRSGPAPSLERLKMCPTKSVFGIVNAVLQPCPLSQRWAVSVCQKNHLPSCSSADVNPSLKIQGKSVLLADYTWGAASGRIAPLGSFWRCPKMCPQSTWSFHFCGN